MRDVFLLGAGFSRAISSHMPLLRDLGDAIQLQPAGWAPSDRDHPNFESDLSFLAESQPWLTHAENLRNRAEFLDASRKLGLNLADMQRKALAAPPPDWLLKLVEWWTEQSSVVATLNYDVLVEKAFTHPMGGGYLMSHWILYPVPISSALARTTLISGRPEIGGFDLLKLHGSMNWYYSGRDSFFGEPIYDSGLVPGWNPDTDAPAEISVIDKTRLIIPPTFGKSVFFQNETVLSIWRQAWQAITDANRVFFIGYSLPASDLNMVRMLRGASFRPGVMVVVNANRNALDHYRDLLPGIEIEGAGGGPDVVASFVTDLIR